MVVLLPVEVRSFAVVHPHQMMHQTMLVAGVRRSMLVAEAPQSMLVAGAAGDPQSMLVVEAAGSAPRSMQFVEAAEAPQSMLVAEARIQTQVPMTVLAKQFFLLQVAVRQTDPPAAVE